MPSYGYQNSGSSGSSGQNSFSNSFSGGNSGSLSMSNSRQSSEGSSSSESGQAWSPEQLSRINALYPGLLKDYDAAKQVDPWSKYMTDVGGAPTTFAPVSPFPTITRGGVYTPEQMQAKENSIFANALTGAGGQAARSEAQLASGGYGGPRSAAAVEARDRIFGLARAGGANEATQWGLGAAEKNAQQRLAAETQDVNRSNLLNAANLARSQGVDQSTLGRINAVGGIRGQDLAYKASQQNALLQALAYYNQPTQFARSKSSQSSSGGSVSSSRSASSNYSNQQSGSSGSSNNNSWGGGENWAWG